MYEFQFPPFVSWTVNICIEIDLTSGIFIPEFDFQMEYVVLIDAEKVIGDYRERAPQ
jgi:hypothetical protein